MRACPVPAPSGRHGLSLGSWRSRPWQGRRGFAVGGRVQGSKERMKVSALGYGLGSWGLLNVVFVLSMFYSGRGKAERRPYEQRAARQFTFDREARLVRGSRAERRRPRAGCDWPVRSSYVQAQGSRRGWRRRNCRRACAGPLLRSFDDSNPRGAYRSGWRRVMRCRV